MARVHGWCMALAAACASSPPPRPAESSPGPASEPAGDVVTPPGAAPPIEADPLIAEMLEQTKGEPAAEAAPPSVPPRAAPPASAPHGPNPLGPTSAQPPDPLEKERADFGAATRDLRVRIGRGVGPDVAKAVAELESRADALGPAEQQAWTEMAFLAASRAKDRRRMRVLAERWLVSCGPDAVASCRKKAMNALEGVARQPPKDAAFSERVKAARKADACLSAIESRKAGGALPACLSGAIDLYRRQGDRLMFARAMLARGQIAAANGRAPGAAIKDVEFAEAACEEPRCRTVRARALERLIDLHGRAGDFERAAATAIRWMALRNASTRLAEPMYARPRAVEEACERLDARAGLGACRALEKRLTGRHTFRDFSVEEAGESLPPDAAKRVFQEYGLLLEECLVEQAARMIPPAAATYAVRWAVTTAGRVEQVHMERRDLDSGPLAECLRRQFVHWRYPRSKGEMQHLEQAFTVRAVER